MTMMMACILNKPNRSYYRGSQSSQRRSNIDRLRATINSELLLYGVAGIKRNRLGFNLR